MSRPARSVSGSRFRLMLPALALVAASNFPSAASAAWHGEGTEGSGIPAISRPPAFNAGAAACDAPTSLIPRDLLKPHASYGTPPAIYGPYRGPQVWGAQPGSLLKTSCLRLRTGGTEHGHAQLPLNV